MTDIQSQDTSTYRDMKHDQATTPLSTPNSTLAHIYHQDPSSMGEHSIANTSSLVSNDEHCTEYTISDDWPPNRLRVIRSSSRIPDTVPTASSSSDQYIALGKELYQEILLSVRTLKCAYPALFNMLMNESMHPYHWGEEEQQFIILVIVRMDECSTDIMDDSGSSVAELDRRISLHLELEEDYQDSTGSNQSSSYSGDGNDSCGPSYDQDITEAMKTNDIEDIVCIRATECATSITPDQSIIKVHFHHPYIKGSFQKLSKNVVESNKKASASTRLSSRMERLENVCKVDNPILIAIYMSNII